MGHLFQALEDSFLLPSSDIRIVHFVMTTTFTTDASIGIGPIDGIRIKIRFQLTAVARSL